jgi:outer membrane protein assembly factor BamB
VVDDTVYATAANRGSADMQLIAINMTNGRSLWTLPLGSVAAGSTWRGEAAIPPCNLLYDAGKLYVLTNNGALLCINTGEKRMTWAFACDGPPISQNGWFGGAEPPEKVQTPTALLLRDNVVYFKERDADDVYAIDLTGPSLKWKRPVSSMETIAGIDQSRLYTAGIDVGGIDLDSRALLWSTRLPVRNGMFKPLMSGGSLFMFLGRGIYQLDIRGGDIQRIFRGYDRDSMGGSVYQNATGLITVSNQAVTAYAADRQAAAGKGQAN